MEKIKLSFWWESSDDHNAHAAVVAYDGELEDKLGEDIFSELRGGFKSPEEIKANAEKLGFDAEVIEI